MYLNRVLKDYDWDFNAKYEVYDFITRFVKSNDGEITEGSEADYIYKIDLPMQQITTLELNWSKIEKAQKLSDELEAEEAFDEVEVCSIEEFLKRHNKLLHYESKNILL